MSSKNNIEEIFSSEFSDFKIEPSSKVWNGINKEIADARFESGYKNAFKGFKIMPSKYTWKKVIAALWIGQFLRFNPFKFNVYYLSVILTSIVGTIIYINNYNKELTIAKNQLQEIKIINSNAKNIINSKHNKHQNIASNNTAIETGENNNDIISTSNNIKDKTSLKESYTQTQNTTQTSNNTIHKEAINTSELESDLIAQSSDNQIDVSTNIKTQKTIQNLNKEKEQNTENTIVNEITETKYTNKFIKIPLNIINFISYKPTISDIADNTISQIPKQDEITYDTIGVDYHGKPILSEKSYFEVGLYISQNLPFYSSKLLNSELLTNYKLYSSNIKPQISYGAGLELAYSYRNIRIETGLAYQELREEINALSNRYKIEENNYYEYYNKEEWNTYTVSILDLDEYLLGNTVYIEHEDSLLIHSTDSTLVTQIDTTLISKQNISASTYKYLEIPLVLGYEFKKGKISFTPKGGVINSILINRKGTFYDIRNDKVILSNNSLDTKFLFNYYVAFNIKYNIAKHASIYVEPYFNSNINSMYNSGYAIEQKGRKYGLRTGIYFKF